MNKNRIENKPMTYLRHILFVVPSRKNDTEHCMSFVKGLARGISDLGLMVHMLKVKKSLNPFNFIRQGLALRAMIRTAKPDIVVAQFGTYVGLLVALFGTRPKIITYRGSDLNPEPRTNAFVQAAQHFASHVASLFADGVICVSQELANRLIFKVPYEIIPSPTDIVLFQVKDQRECRKLCGWENTKHIAVFFGGSMPKNKGIDLAREIKKELGRRKSFVEVEILDHEIPLSETPVYLNAADCLLFLSRYEGSPNLIREACACNLPLVTTQVGDVAKVLLNIVPKQIVLRKIDDIIKALEDVCRDRLRSNGRDHIMEYSTEVISRRTVEFYEEIISHYRLKRR